MAEGKIGEHLVTFKSGNYKKVTGAWKGDSVWMQFIKTHSGMVHVNKDEVEHVESFDAPAAPRTPKILFPEIEEMITVDQKEIIRREYFLNRKSMQKIAKELHHSCTKIRKAIYDPVIPTDVERPRSHHSMRPPAAPP